jgi:hypothetical protein
MLKVTVLALPLFLLSAVSSASQGNWQEQTGWNDGWQYSPEQSLDRQDFADHVKQLCLGQVLEEDLEAKYINEYLVECAADYGVFNIAAN